MRYQTEAVGETTWLLGELPSGGAVTITLYKLSDSSTPALDSNACTEIGATGVYKWATTNITTPETTKTEYLYVMTDGTLNYFGKIVVGGYVDKINANISTRSSHAAADVWSVGTRALTDKAGFALSSAGITAIWNKNISAFSGAGYAGTYVKTLYDDWINGGRLDLLIDRIKTATEIKQAAVNDATATTTKFTTNLTETSNDFWNRMAVLFTSGNNIGQMRRIKDYKGSTKEITVQTPLDVAPANNDTFIIPAARAFLTVDIADIVDEVWDEILTGATHNIATSAGKRLRQIGAYNIHDGTAQATSTCCSITLAATASSEDYIYNRNLIVIIDGTGAGQTRTIADYDGTTKIAVVDRNWWTLPDDTSEYYILADDTPLVVDHGIAQGGESTSITLRSSASAIDETYTGSVVVILASTGEGQSRLITAYDGTTKVATITPAWETNPTSSSIYVVMPYGCSCVGNLTDSALAQINATLESAHGTNSWKTATGFAKPSDVKVTCGGGGGGGAIIERPAIWKPEEKLKLIEDIKKMYKMINELSSLQSVGLQNVKNNIEGLKNSLLKLIKEEVALLISLKVIISGQPKTDNSAMLADSINQIIAKWDSVQKSILKPSDLSSLDNKLDDITKIVAKSLSNKDLEELINEE